MTRRWLLAAGFLCACSNPPATHVVVDGAPVTVTGTLQRRIVSHPPCGGVARPRGEASPEPNEYLAPWGGTSLAIRAGVENSETPVVATVVTGSAGAFSVTLDPGPYCVLYEGAKKGPPPREKTVQGKTPSDFWTDMDCMRARWRRCDAVLIVPGPADLTITYETTGSGCLGECRHGPTPP